MVVIACCPRPQVIFARREFPGSIAIIVSDSDGEAWSDAEIIRDDASGGDIGYPYAIQSFLLLNQSFLLLTEEL
eukprot:SAG31_NODE_21_length_34109_cov_60.598824_17_plen_74_part_00